MALRRKFTLLLFAVILLPLLLAGYLSYGVAHESLETAQLTKIAGIADLKAKKIRSFLQERANNLQEILASSLPRESLPILVASASHSASREYLAIKKTLDARFKIMQEAYPIHDIIVTGADGRMLYLSNDQHHSKGFLEKLPLPETHPFSNGETIFSLSSMFQNPREDGQWASFMIAPVYGADKQQVGSIALEIDFSPLYDIIASEEGFDGQSITALGQKISENSFVHLRKDALTKETPVDFVTDKILPMQQALQGKSGSGMVYNWLEDPILAAWQPIPELGLGLVTKIPVQKAFAPIRTLRNIIIAVMLVSTGIGFFIAARLAGTITSPILRLREGAKTIGQGNLDYRLRLKRNDELGDLGEAIDQMAENLQFITDERSRFFCISMEMLCIADFNGYFKEINPAFEKVLGFNKEHFLKVPFLELVHPEDREKTINEVEKLTSGAPTINFQNRFLCSNGQYKWLSWTTMPVPEEKLLYASARDITERQEAQEALEIRERDYRNLFASIPDTIVVSDNNRTILDVNQPALSEMFGYESQEIRGKTSSLFYHSNKDFEKSGQAVFQHQYPKQGEVFEAKFKRKDGSIFTGELFALKMLDQGSEPIGNLAIIRDISKRKAAEKALQVSERKFRDLVESTSDWIWEIDENGFYTYVSPQVGNILGYQPDEILGKTPFDLMPDAEKHRVSEEFKHIAARQKSFSGLENINQHKNGKLVVIETSGVPFSDQQGNFRGYRGIDRDITDRKEKEEELKKTAEQLCLVNQKLEITNQELESFSYSISHDLRAPLRTLAGFSQAVQEDYADRLDEQGRDYLGRIRRASQKMGVLIDDLLKLSRITRTEMTFTTVDLGTLLKKIANKYREGEKDRNVEFLVEEGLAVDGDESLLKVALENLFANAWKFTGKTSSAVIEFGCRDKGSQKEFYIRDNGSGFDMAYADKLFTPFQRLHSNKEFSGTGIGLATVQRVIHAHGGTIWAEGETDQGATFYFTLGTEGVADD